MEKHSSRMQLTKRRAAVRLRHLLDEFHLFAGEPGRPAHQIATVLESRCPMSSLRGKREPDGVAVWLWPL